MNESSKVVYLEKNQPSHGPVVKAGEYGKVAATCRGILFETLNDAMRDLFAQVDDDLYKLAENSTSNAQQTLFFDAMRTVRLRQKEIEGGFLRLVEEAYQTFWDGGTILSARLAETSEDMSLALVEKEELEEELAVTTMVTKTTDHCHRELVPLNARFAHMLKRQDLPLEANPVSPALLAMAFREALSVWDGEMLARIVVYKCFERVVLSRMQGCYAAMNRHLTENGVLPDFRHGAAVRQPPRGAAAGGAAPPAPEDAAEGTVEAAEEAAVPSLQQLWQALQQLGRMAAFTGLSLPVDPSLPVMPRAGVVQALGQLQQDLLSDPELQQMDTALQQEFIRQQLVHLLGRNEEGRETHRVGDSEKQTIDLILALFNHVLDDPNLPDAMRALIARLQIPVLKAAIADAGFIENGSHPARRLIDDLARASMGWRDDGDRSEKSLYFQVKRAVERIVHEFEDDVALFEEVREEFGEWLAQRERVRQIMEQRLAQAVSGEERLTVAKMKVDELFEELEVETLPEHARKILQGPWKKLLTILWLREGEEGNNWKKAVQIASLMAKYLSGSRQDFRREQLLADIPEIIGGLKKGFTYISLDQKKSARLLNGLQSCFIQALRPLPSRSRKETAESVEEAAPAANQKEEAEASPEPDEYDRQVAAITEGTWIRLLPETEEEEPMVCKLVWRSKYTGTMVFVDGQGNKAAQLKEEELAEAFRQGRGALLEEAQAPLIDRALRKMMRVLNAEIVGLRLKMAD